MDLNPFSSLATMGKGIFDMFHKPPNPSDAAMKYLNQIPGMAKEQYSPWISNATNMMPGMSDLYNRMMQNPGEYFNQISSGYRQSPGYQNALREAMGGIANAQAAGGMAGSPQHQQIAGERATQMADKDFQDYINNILGIQKTGLTGGEAALGRGFEGSKSMADILASNLGQQAGYSAAGQAQRNNQNSQNWSNIFSGASGVMPWLFQGNNQWKNPGAMPGWE